MTNKDVVLAVVAGALFAILVYNSKQLSFDVVNNGKDVFSIKLTA